MCGRCTERIYSDKLIERMVNGEYHCDTKPAIVELYSNGNIKTKSWYYNGKLHRDNMKKHDLPACIGYYPSGRLKYQSWIKHDVYYRECGPARIWFDIDGHVQKQVYYIEGVEYEPMTKSALKM